MQQPLVLTQDDLRYIASELIVSGPGAHFAPNAVAGQLHAEAP
ncbi:hypothetical protein ABIB17_001272 [Arthrobacter sp. UYEF6]